MLLNKNNGPGTRIIVCSGYNNTCILFSFCYFSHCFRHESLFCLSLLASCTHLLILLSYLDTQSEASALLLCPTRCHVTSPSSPLLYDPAIMYSWLTVNPGHSSQCDGFAMTVICWFLDNDGAAVAYVVLYGVFRGNCSLIDTVYTRWHSSSEDDTTLICAAVHV